jgi:hypothetical protein
VKGKIAMNKAILTALTASAVLFLWTAKLGMPPVKRDSPGAATPSTAADEPSLAAFDRLRAFTMRSSGGAWLGGPFLGLDRLPGPSTAGTPACKAGRSAPEQPREPAWPVSNRFYALIGPTGSELIEQVARQPQQSAPRARALRQHGKRIPRNLVARAPPLASPHACRLGGAG